MRSFRNVDAIRIARERGVAIVIAGDSKYPLIADLTAPFVYKRIMGAKKTIKTGYSKPSIATWARRMKDLSTGKPAERHDLCSARLSRQMARDVSLYVISGRKAHNPVAAAALIAELKK